MDSRLQECLNKWHSHLDDLRRAESECLSLEGSEKSIFAELFLNVNGKNIAERESGAYSTEEWKNFKDQLVDAKCRYNHKKRVLELIQKEFDAEYLSFKVEADAIRRNI